MKSAANIGARQNYGDMLCCPCTNTTGQRSGWRNPLNFKTWILHHTVPYAWTKRAVRSSEQTVSLIMHRLYDVQNYFLVDIRTNMHNLEIIHKIYFTSLKMHPTKPCPAVHLSGEIKELIAG